VRRGDVGDNVVPGRICLEGLVDHEDVEATQAVAEICVREFVERGYNKRIAVVLRIGGAGLRDSGKGSDVRREFAAVGVDESDRKIWVQFLYPGDQALDLLIGRCYQRDTQSLCPEHADGC
jgi:hypothetical protein